MPRDKLTANGSITSSGKLLTKMLAMDLQYLFG